MYSRNINCKSNEYFSQLFIDFYFWLFELGRSNLILFDNGIDFLRKYLKNFFLMTTYHCNNFITGRKWIWRLLLRHEIFFVVKITVVNFFATNKEDSRGKVFLPKHRERKKEMTLHAFLLLFVINSCFIDGNLLKMPLMCSSVHFPPLQHTIWDNDFMRRDGTLHHVNSIIGLLRS